MTIKVRNGQERNASDETTSSMNMSKSSPTSSIPKYDYDFDSPKMELDSGCTTTLGQELIDVQVTVPGELYAKYANSGYTFFVMNKQQVPDNLKQNIIPRPNPRPIDPQFQFTAPAPAVHQQHQMTHSTPLVKTEPQIHTFSELSIKDEYPINISDVAFDSLITTDESGLSQLIDGCFDQLFWSTHTHIVFFIQSELFSTLHSMF